ncbi:MAG: TetR/AcrR family transcriptional regulator [Pseudomonadaceae bacterium]|nr:TetR/AcrR family transcriptional regulator [Pseudomonadaceae bacterium]
MNKVAKRPVGRPRSDGRPPLERQQVLLEAGRLITEHGYAATSLRMIAQALGTSAPAIAQRFGSKAELLNELVSMMSQFSIRFHSSLKALDLPADIRLYKMVHAEVMALASAEHAPVSVFYLPELRQPQFKPAQQARARMMRFYYDVITDGIQSGLFNPVRVGIAAEQVFQLTETIIIAQDRPAMGHPAQLAEQTADFVLRGLLAKPGRHGSVRMAAEKIDLSMT